LTEEEAKNKLKQKTNRQLIQKEKNEAEEAEKAEEG
jgi:hypothetical protein